jgi:hypothetical protein
MLEDLSTSGETSALPPLLLLQIPGKAMLHILKVMLHILKDMLHILKDLHQIPFKLLLRILIKLLLHLQIPINLWTRNI